jgi:hypothetical protein
MDPVADPEGGNMSPLYDDLVALYLTFSDEPGDMLRMTVEVVKLSGEVLTVATHYGRKPIDIERLTRAVMKSVAKTMVKYHIGH